MFILLLDFRKLCLKGKFANFVTLNNLERWQQSFGANYNGAAHFWLSSTTSTEIIFGDGDDNNDVKQLSSQWPPQGPPWVDVWAWGQRDWRERETKRSRILCDYLEQGDRRGKEIILNKDRWGNFFVQIRILPALSPSELALTETQLFEESQVCKHFPTLSAYHHLWNDILRIFLKVRIFCILVCRCIATLEEHGTIQDLLVLGQILCKKDAAKNFCWFLKFVLWNWMRQLDGFRHRHRLKLFLPSQWIGSSVQLQNPKNVCIFWSAQ